MCARRAASSRHVGHSNLIYAPLDARTSSYERSEPVAEFVKNNARARTGERHKFSANVTGEMCVRASPTSVVDLSAIDPRSLNNLQVSRSLNESLHREGNSNVRARIQRARERKMLADCCAESSLWNCSLLALASKILLEINDEIKTANEKKERR